MHAVEKTVEGPQLRIVEQILEAPEIQMARVVSEDAIVDLGGVAEDLCKDSTLIMHFVTKSGAWAGVKALIMDLITRLQAESLSETSGADGQMSSLFQESCDVVSKTMKGLSGVCEEKHMSGTLETSGVDRTFRTERHRKHGQRDHVTEEQTKRRARMARQVWVKCGTKTNPLELNDETPEEIERKVRRLVNVNCSEKVCVLCQGKVVQWSKWMEMEEGCIFEVMRLMKGGGNRRRRRKTKIRV